MEKKHKKQKPYPYQDSRIKLKDLNDLTSSENVGFRLVSGFNALGHNDDSEPPNELIERSRHRPRVVRSGGFWVSNRKPAY
jgi:hypothetical protein